MATCQIDEVFDEVRVPGVSRCKNAATHRVRRGETWFRICYDCAMTYLSSMEIDEGPDEDN
jgi:hypothetical protein